MSNPRLRNIVFHASLVFLIFLSSVFLAEGVMRVYHRINKEKHYVYIPDYYLGYRLASNNEFEWLGDRLHPEYHTRQRTNSLGLMGSEARFKKKRSVYRILLLGDSFSEALQVHEEEKYCRQLEALLNTKNPNPRQRFEVLNAGTRGYSPIVYYLSFKKKLSAFRPDLVIVQLFANDIFEDNHVRAKSVLDKEGLPVKLNHFFSEKYFNKKDQYQEFQHEPFWLAWHEWLLDHSSLYEYIVYQRIQMEKRSALNKKMRDLPNYNDGYQFFILQRHDEAKLFGDKDFSTKTLGYTKQYLLALNDLVKAKGSQFLMMYIPMEAELPLQNYSQSTRKFFGQQAAARMDDFLNNLAQVYKINFLDIAPIFKKHLEEKLYFNFDGHLTPRGHTLVAEALWKNMITQILKKRLHR